MSVPGAEEKKVKHLVPGDILVGGTQQWLLLSIVRVQSYKFAVSFLTQPDSYGSMIAAMYMYGEDTVYVINAPPAMAHPEHTE